MYEYLIGVVILFIVWLILFFIRKDLRKPMIWSGLAYLLIVTGYHIIWLIVSNFVYLGEAVIPAYWNPDTLFNLGRITKGIAIEDLLFMFFVGGIATSIYEIFTKSKISLKKTRRPHIIAPLIGVIVSFLFMLMFKPNPIYPFILFGFSAAIFLLVQRKDLIKHAIYGGLIFLFIYFISYSLFNIIFPDFISNAYALENLSGIIILKIPLEEYLYALSLGMLWSPLYEYWHGERNTKRV